MKKPLALCRVLSEDPTKLGGRNQGFLNQVPT